jgi:uncharacterized protein (TIGR00369 family)
MAPSLYQPTDSHYAARVRDSFDRQHFMHHIGAIVTAVTPGHCEIELAYRPELTQQHGYFHAGIIGTLADNAGGYAALSLLPPGKEVLTVEYKLNLLRPGEGERLVSRGKVLKAGRTLIISQVDVYNIKKGSETLAATALMTLMGVAQREAVS